MPRWPGSRRISIAAHELVAILANSAAQRRRLGLAGGLGIGGWGTRVSCLGAAMGIKDSARRDFLRFAQDIVAC